ncbi:MAG: carbonic anhydrase [Bdellovibrionales bacterium]
MPLFYPSLRNSVDQLMEQNPDWSPAELVLITQIRESSNRSLARFLSHEHMHDAPSGFFRISVAIFEFFRMAAREVQGSSVRNWRNFHEINNGNGGLFSLWKKQQPHYTKIRCADSRADIIIDDRPGKITIQAVVGGSVENVNAPGELSEGTKQNIALTSHLGIKTIVVASHGRCGHVKAMLDGKNHLSSDEQGISEEAKQWRRMAAAKQWLFKAANDPAKVEDTVAKIDFVPEQDERRYLAAELLQGLKNVELLEKYLSKYYPDSGIQVVLVHQEIRDLSNIHMYNRNRGRYVRITNHAPSNLVKAYIDLGHRMCGYNNRVKSSLPSIKHKISHFLKNYI